MGTLDFRHPWLYLYYLLPLSGLHVKSDPLFTGQNLRFMLTKVFLWFETTGKQCRFGITISVIEKLIEICKNTAHVPNNNIRYFTLLTSGFRKRIPTASLFPKQNARWRNNSCQVCRDHESSERPQAVSICQRISINSTTCSFCVLPCIRKWI